MRADRLLDLMTLLRQHERVSAAELARRLEVTPRTVMRDIDALSLAGVPVYATRGRDGGYSLLPGYRPRADSLTKDESEALFVAGAPEVAKALGMDAAFARALRKLADSLPEAESHAIGAARRRIVVDPGGWSGTVSEDAFLGELFQAVQDERRVRMDYAARAASGASERVVDPWGLVLAGGTWYLVAARDRVPRTYRVSRMQSVTVLEEPARVPADLDLLEVWHRLRDAFTAQPGTMVTLRMGARHWDLVRRMMQITVRGAPEVVTDGDNLVVTVEVLALRGAAGTLLGMGTWVEVLDPPELRTLMHDLAAEVQQLYSVSQ